MKRKNDLYSKIISMPNLVLAEKKACKGRKKQKAVKKYMAARGCNLIALHNALAEQSFTTSQYTTFKVFEPKERLVYRLPLYPDRIVQHAIMDILEPVFVSKFTADSYSCIKGKGIHDAANKLKIALKNREATRYCLKLDITKFYPSVKHDILKWQLRRIIKDAALLKLLDNIIDSAEGLPIGNYLSQYLANFYLTSFDHWIKEVMCVKHYFRYADDIVILAASKPYLQGLLANIRTYFNDHLKLTINPKYQVFPVAQKRGRGIDFVGYVFYHTHTLLRKTIKQNMARRRNNPVSAVAYYGWALHCNSRHLLKKLKTHDTIQRLRHKAGGTGVYRRKIKNRENIQRRNKNTGLQVRAQQV